MYIMITILIIILVLTSLNAPGTVDNLEIPEIEVPLGNVREIEKETINAPKDFIIYYNELNDRNIKILSEYDVIIIEPRNATKKQVMDLKKSGAKVLGYISVVEQNENSMEFKSIKDSWFYRPGGNKIKVERWKSWIVDISNKSYQNFLFEQIHIHIVNKDIDGVFFDTVGDIDDYNWDEMDKTDMRESYAGFLKKIKKNNRNLEIVQNWGFYTAKNYSQRYIDGIMWEGFTYELIEKDQWSKERYTEIQRMNLDFYAVTPSVQNEEKAIKYNVNGITDKGNLTYIYVRNSDVYGDLD